MYFSSNLKLLRKRKNKTQDDISFALKMKRSTYSGYENDVAEPGMDALMSIAKYYNIAIDTLLKVDLSKLTGTQLYQLEHGSDVYIRGGNLRILATTADQTNQENIELVPERAKAGYRTGYADPEFISELPKFQLPFLSPGKKYRTFQLKGDSMLPIPDGSWVTGEFVTDWTTLVSGQAYIIFTLDDGIMFKIVENLIRKEAKLTLYSLNPLYEPYDVPVKEVKEVWKFIHYISNEIPDPILPEEKLLSTVAKLKSEVERIKSRIRH
jgi:transcriptional regulator with XRE-family HTH domain